MNQKIKKNEHIQTMCLKAHTLEGLGQDRYELLTYR